MAQIAKKSAWNVGDLGLIAWRRKWQPTTVFLPIEFHGQRSLVNYCPWGCKDSDMTGRLTPLQSKLCMEREEAEMGIA